jgi:chromosome segregation ATPase
MTSWLKASGLTQSVTGTLSSIGGQLKDILTEGTEDIVDAETEARSFSDRLKETDRQHELVKNECQRWREEAAELSLRCQSYEAQLEQKNGDHREQLAVKEVQIGELRNQIVQLQTAAAVADKQDKEHHGQKSAFMEEFEGKQNIYRSNFVKSD